MSERLQRRVTYIIRGRPEFGLMEGFCIMGLTWASAYDCDKAREDGRFKTLKCWPQFFDALMNGAKTFELRRDDRTPPYEVGDVLNIERFVPKESDNGEES